MLTLGIALGMALQKAEIGLEYRDGAFVMNDGQGERKIVIDPPRPPAQTVFSTKVKNTWMVWDNRGLTLRTGDKVASTRFPYIPTSPKVLSREQILETIEKIDQGKRQREASALAGHALVGDSMFFLVRWEESDGRPWLEVLVKVDATADDPKPEFVGKMPSSSFAQGTIDNQLFYRGTRVGAVGRLGDDWGLSAYNLEDGSVSFTKFGQGLLRASVQPGHTMVLFVERTGYGTQIAGSVDLTTMARTDYAESRDSLSFFSAKPLLIRTDDAKGVTLRYVETGAEVRVPVGTEARMTGVGVLAWAPANAPRKAFLFDPARWIQVGSWTAKPGEVTAALGNSPPPAPNAPTKAPPPKPKEPATSTKSASAMALAAARGDTGAKKPEPAPKSEPAKKPAPKVSEEKAAPKKKVAKPKIEISVKKKGG